MPVSGAYWNVSEGNFQVELDKEGSLPEFDEIRDSLMECIVDDRSFRVRASESGMPSFTDDPGGQGR